MMRLFHYMWRTSWRNPLALLRLWLYYGALAALFALGLSKLAPEQHAISSLMASCLLLLFTLHYIPQQLQYHAQQQFWLHIKQSSTPLIMALGAFYLVALAILLLSGLLLVLLFHLWLALPLVPHLALLSLLLPLSCLVLLVSSLGNHNALPMLGLLLLPLVIPLLLINLQLLFAADIMRLFWVNMAFFAVLLPVSLLTSSLCLKQHI